MLLKRPDLRQAADHAYRFLMRYCMDRKAGGVYWSVTFDGKPLDTTKHTYNQAFAIYALSAYYRLTGNPKALFAANQLFQCVENHCRDAGGYGEAYDRFWNPESNEKLSENGVMAERTMNTLLHVFEGYSGLYQATQAPEVGTELRALLDIWGKHMFQPEKRRQEVFFDKNYHSMIDLQSYGHDIESAWLLDWGCDLLGDAALAEKVHRMTDVLAQSVLNAALTAKPSATKSKRCDRYRPDLVGAVRGDRWILSICWKNTLNRSSTAKPPRKCGSIFCGSWWTRGKTANGSGKWDITGKPVKKLTIVDPWKCPYHNGRMCMEIIRRNPDVSC